MSPRYKIVYFIDNLSKKGGIEKVLSTKASYFADVLLYEVHILLFQSKTEALSYKYSPNICMHYLDKPFVSGTTIPIVSQQLLVFRAKKYYTNLLKIIKPDIIIGLGLGVGDLIFPSIAHKLRVPIVREFHYSTIAVQKTIELIRSRNKRIRQRFIFRRMFRSFERYDRLVLLTRQDAQEGNYRVPCSIIPNTLNPFDCAQKSTCESRRVISVGSMRNRIKRFDRQIILWKEIVNKYPDWVLDIYGDGEERVRLQALIDELDLSTSVTLHGNVNNISDKYLDSSIFIFTSDGEGLPMVIIEALSCGLPCVSYACSCGPMDTIRDGVDGYVVNVDDQDAFVEKLELLIENEDLRKQMGRNALMRSMDFSVEKIIPMWVAYFDEVVNANK